MKNQSGLQNIAASRRSERGMASIVITMVTMVVISLIVLGFAVISRREQRQSLDQLQSSQAFYAAESGVEDAKSIIKTAVAAGQPVVGKDNCTTNNPGGSYPTGAQMVVDGNYSVSYTCLKVDPAPDNLRFDGIGDNGVVVPVTSAQPITSVRVSWTPTTPPTGNPNVCPADIDHSFGPQTAAGWPCEYGVLRADVVPTGGGLTRAGLTANTLTSFFEPTRNNATGSLDYTAGRGHANIVAANCTTASYTKCTATVSGITGGATSLTLRLSSMYRSSNMTIESLNGTNTQGITGVQAVIDSTGKATDVLRRIEVRLPIVQTGGLLPNYAVQSSASLCKRFSTTPSYFNIPGDIAGPIDTANDMCVSKTDGTP